jgi:hypothetical protein
MCASTGLALTAVMSISTAMVVESEPQQMMDTIAIALAVHQAISIKYVSKDRQFAQLKQLQISKISESLPFKWGLRAPFFYI